MNRKISIISWCYAILSPIVFFVIVLVLGLITPGYDHLRDTISILAIMKYGIIQQLNFMQIGIGLVIAGFMVNHKLASKYAQNVWNRIVLFCIAFVAVVIIFPTDLVGQIPITHTHLTVMGVVHLSALAAFFLLAPLGIYHLQKALKGEPKFAHLAKFTAISGYISSILCYLWTYWFIKGDFYQYLGVFQKIIMVITFGWLISLIYAARPHLNQKELSLK